MKNRKDLYIRGINLIHEYFARQGITVSIGIEIEFLAPRPADETGRKFFGEIPPKFQDTAIDHIVPIGKLNQYESSLRNTIKDIAKKQGGIIAFKTEVPVDKYEVVMCPMTPVDAVTAAERVKTALLQLVLPDMQANKWADKVSFGSYEGRIMPALHTNIGMTMNGKDIFKRSDLLPTEFAVALAHGMKAAVHETTALVAPFPSSYGRFVSELHSSYPKKVAVNSQNCTKDGKSIGLRHREVERENCMFPPHGKDALESVHWIENRVPSGDCQPYVAVFTTMLAAYDSFRKIAKFDAGAELLIRDGLPELSGDAQVKRKDHDISGDLQTARSIFAQGKIMRRRMNELDSAGQFGEQLYKIELENQAKIRRKTKSRPSEEQQSLGALR